MAISTEEDQDDRIQRLADNFQVVLSPMEPTIMRLQSLLVWESPAKSAVMIVGVHVIFWFFAYSGCRLYSTACWVFMILYFIHTWRKRIWPEIRVPPKSPDINEWTPVHPRLLSVPEISKHLSNSWCYLERCVKWWINLRANRPFKFCVEVCFLCICGAVIGSYLSGVTLSYIVVMSLVLWPCLQYHNLLKKIYMKFEPIFMKLDYSIKVKNKWKYKGDRTNPVVTTKEGSDNGTHTSSFCADNESDLEDFDPTDPIISAALARAITDSEDEGSPQSTSLTPHLSKEPSVTYSDEDNNVLHEDDLEDDFALSIDAMPSFEALDNTDDEILESDFALDDSTMPSLLPKLSKKSRREAEIDFDSSHFDNHSSDEDTVGLDSSPIKSKPQGKPKKRQATKQPEMGDLVKDTLNAAMQTAIQNSVMGALQNLTGISQNQASNDCDRKASTHRHRDTDTVDHGHKGASRERLGSDDSATLDIEEDFDFLDEYDLDTSRESGGQEH